MAGYVFENVEIAAYTVLISAARATQDAQNATLSLEKLGSRELRKLRARYSSLGEIDQINLDLASTRESATKESGR